MQLLRAVMVGVIWIAEKGRKKLWLLFSWSTLSGTVQLFSSCSCPEWQSFQSKLWCHFVSSFFSPILHPLFSFRLRQHVRCITACQNRSVFGKSKIRLKCKHTKNHPCPLSSTTQSLQNSLMIKADSNTWPISGMLSTVHRFFSCRLCPCEQRALGAAALAACAGSLIAMGILPQTSKQGQGSRLGFT